MGGDAKDVSANDVVVVGAGPAGLTAAYELLKLGAGYRPIVLEASDTVGGISRTEEHNGYRFDIGGHRFFTKVPEVDAMWHEVLGDDFITVARRSRIYYRGRYFAYPLQLMDAMRNIGPYESFRIIISYLKWQLRPYRPEETFEKWVVNRFGGRLYKHFFRVYTEKVWGIPATQIQADWAAQRIKDLSLFKAVWNALSGKTTATSLIDQFKYPRLGPGMMWERTRDRIVESGGVVRLRTEVVRLNLRGRRVVSVDVRDCSREGSQATTHEVAAGHVISSMALRDLVHAFHPPPPDAVREAAARLRYRDFAIVTLCLDHPDPFSDNWIYIHSPGVRVGRIQNFRAWSADMLADPTKASLGMEYFCSQGDALWSLSDDAFIRLAAEELERLGLAKATTVIDAKVIRQRMAYPVYDTEYRQALDTISAWLGTLENVQTVGRNGLHRYNNQDHSMLSAMLAVRNIAGEAHDIWNVNVERSYHEDFQVESKPAALAAQ